MAHHDVYTTWPSTKYLTTRVLFTQRVLIAEIELSFFPHYARCVREGDETLNT